VKTAAPPLGGLQSGFAPSGIVPRPDLKLAVFDFDGTLSWLRHGWPGMMLEVFRPHVRRMEGETAESLEGLLLDEIIARNGQPSIRQCERLAEITRQRGGPALDPEEMRLQFQRKLDAAIERRSARIGAGTVPREDYLIPGATAFLERVVGAGLTPVILSSTIQDRLETEAALLGIAAIFGSHIYGGTGDPRTFSKRAVFERLLREEGITGQRLLAFGDGPTEIRDAAELGGLAIAVCSDEEHNGSGLLDERKRRQLLEAGAQLAIPDFRGAARLLDSLLGR
jgi:phosphoserine phosphatase